MVNQEFKEKHKCLCGAFLVILSLFLVALIVSTGVDIKNKIVETKNTISVSSTGEIYAKPDLAIINFSVVVEKKTVAEALSENAEKMNAVINFIKGQGIEEKDLKTAFFNIYPRYEWYGQSEIYPQGKRVLVGYEVTQQLEVKIRDMTKIGDIIQGATNAGANQVGDLQLTIDKQDELKKQARTEAIEKAKDKAEELAFQLGVKLGKITDFSESAQFPYFYSYKLEAAVPGAGGGAPQMETGENKIEVTVVITYEIR